MKTFQVAVVAVPEGATGTDPVIVGVRDVTGFEGSPDACSRPAQQTAVYDDVAATGRETRQVYLGGGTQMEINVHLNLRKPNLVTP